MKIIFNYFLRGLLFIFPIFATLYVVIQLVNWLDDLFRSLIYDWLPVQIPGLGIITAFLVITLLGFIISRAISKPLLSYFENLLSRIPLIKIIYTALKDFIEAVAGDKKRFNQPVIISFTDGVDRVGFITEKNLGLLNLNNRVAVYCPHSYNFSGNLYLVDPERVTLLDVNPSDAMKFAVSAGVTKIDN